MGRAPEPQGNRSQVYLLERMPPGFRRLGTRYHGILHTLPSERYSPKQVRRDELSPFPYGMGSLSPFKLFPPILGTPTAVREGHKRRQSFQFENARRAKELFL